MAEERRTYPCPGCGELLLQTGEVVIDGRVTLPTFQCDRCVVTRPMFGEMALTFMLGEDGKPFDPCDPDGIVRL